MRNLEDVLKRSCGWFRKTISIASTWLRSTSEGTLPRHRIPSPWAVQVRGSHVANQGIITAIISSEVAQEDMLVLHYRKAATTPPLNKSLGFLQNTCTAPVAPLSTNSVASVRTLVNLEGEVCRPRTESRPLPAWSLSVSMSHGFWVLGRRPSGLFRPASAISSCLFLMKHQHIRGSTYGFVSPSWFFPSTVDVCSGTSVCYCTGPSVASNGSSLSNQHLLCRGKTPSSHSDVLYHSSFVVHLVWFHPGADQTALTLRVNPAQAWIFVPGHRVCMRMSLSKAWKLHNCFCLSFPSFLTFGPSSR